MAEITLTVDNFEEEVLKSDKKVLVDFWATWCGPCIMLAPIIEEVAEAYADRVKLGKVNVDEQPELANAFEISNIPTVMVFEKGQLKDKVVGYRPKADIEALLK